MAAEDEVHVFAKIIAKPEKVEQVRAGLVKLVAAILLEPGMVHYMMHEDSRQPGAFFFFETYQDQAAVEAHMRSPHLARTFDVIGGFLAEPLEVHFTKAVAGR